MAKTMKGLELLPELGIMNGTIGAIDLQTKTTTNFSKGFTLY
jgi:hypothetical protein